MDWDSIGVSDSPLIDVTSDALAMGEPSWPHGYQRYRLVRTWQSLILASEGLGPTELYLEMPTAQGWLGKQVRNQWQFELLSSLCRSLVTAQWPDAPFVVMAPAAFSAPPQLTGGRMMAAIVGIPVPGRTVEALPVTPMTAREFAYVQGGGALDPVIQARQEMGFHHVVVDAPEVTSLLDDRLPTP